VRLTNNPRVQHLHQGPCHRDHEKSSRTDETYPLATQLIAAKLNAGCAHTDSSCVASAVARLRIDGCVRIRLGAMSRRAVPPGVLPATLKNAAGTAAATVVRS